MNLSPTRRQELLLAWATDGYQEVMRQTGWQERQARRTIHTLVKEEFRRRCFALPRGHQGYEQAKQTIQQPHFFLEELT